MVSSHHVSPDGADVLRRTASSDPSAQNTLPGQVAVTVDELEDRIVRVDDLDPDEHGDTPRDDTNPDVPGSGEPPD